MSINAARGFPGCVGSIDCQHWEWEKCPIAWAGQYKGEEKKPTIVLEAICDSELWIWHAFFGSPGSLNDINILDHSPTVEKIVAGEFPPSLYYEVNGVQRTIPYYLADGIYPNWAIFAKTISEGSTKKERNYARAQEAFRKDIERAFGVLITRFHILRYPARLWYQTDIARVMKACIIIHNMIVETRRDNYESVISSLQFFEEATSMFEDDSVFEWQSRTAAEMAASGVLPDGTWAAMVVERENSITNTEDHFSLKQALIEQVWKRQEML